MSKKALAEMISTIIIAVITVVYVVLYSVLVFANEKYGFSYLTSFIFAGGLVVLIVGLAIFVFLWINETNIQKGSLNENFYNLGKRIEFYNLDTFTKVGIRKKYQKNAEHSFIVSYSPIKTNVIYESYQADQVKELYFSALVTESSLALLRENLKSMNKLYEVTQNSVNVGVAEQTSADQLKVQAVSMEATINSTERALEMVYNMMRLQLTLDEDVKIVLTQTVDDLLDLEYVDKLMAETLELDRNYDYQLLKNSTELARKQVTASSLSNTPTLSVFHQYTYKHYFSNEMTMNMTPPNMMGVSLSVPIFTSLANTASHKDAKLAYDKQLNTLMDTELALKVQHSQMVFNLKSAVEKYYTQRQGFEVAQRVFDNMTKKYLT